MQEAKSKIHFYSQFPQQLYNSFSNESCLSFLATSEQCEKKLENYAHSQAKTQLKYKNYFLLRDGI